MEITKLSSEGQAIIPQSLRETHHLEVSQELRAINRGDEILRKPKKPFPETTLDDVAGSLNDQGKPQSFGDVDYALRQGVEELWHSRG